MPDRLLNEQPRPRVVVNAWDATIGDTLEALQTWPGTVKKAVPQDVNWNEWDVYITDNVTYDTSSGTGDRRYVPDHVPVFVILQDWTGAVDLGPQPSQGRQLERLQHVGSRGEHLHSPEGLGAEVRGLIESSLLPDLLARDLLNGHGQGELIVFPRRRTHRSSCVPSSGPRTE